MISFGLNFYSCSLTSFASPQKIQSVEKLIINAELIANSLEEVGNNSIVIRDAAVVELDNFCPSNPQLDEMTGVNIVQVADKAKSDLTMLANFIEEGIGTLKEALAKMRVFANDVNNGITEAAFWGWQMKLLSAGLFILPSFLVVGVGLVMLDLDVKPYQSFLSYFIMPIFVVVTIIVYIVCSAILPISATNAGMYAVII